VDYLGGTGISLTASHDSDTDAAGDASDLEY